jgi:hypothetical protein
MASVKIRDRIKELRRVKASELIAHPRNWRVHPKNQKEYLESVLKEIGYADALIAYESNGKLCLIDGHMRQEVTPDQEVPVLVLDVSEEEAEKILITHDPIAGYAQTDRKLLDEAIRSVSAGEENLQELIARIALENKITPPEMPGFDPREEWKGMPEFKHDNQESKQSIIIHFKSHKDAQEFGALIGQPITENTKSIWHPKNVVQEVNRIGKHYADEE